MSLSKEFFRQIIRGWRAAMLFSSVIFICIFLPCTLIGYYLIFRWNRTLQNIFLFLVSIFFYAWGEPKFVLVMLGSIIFNWAAALLVAKAQLKNNKIAKCLLALSIVCNLAVLFIYKYLNFTGDTLQSIFGISLNLPRTVLPIGISFFTFQAMSYVIDVYRHDGEAQYNPLNVGLYISFFPQLIAGPIVRYETIAEQIKGRKETRNDFFDGFSRFVIGFCKKVLLANTLAIVADSAFSTSQYGEITVMFSWLGAICYTLQIFFDFSGYSDMAIGLGKMFGFHFLENFDHPYVSLSITEFWRRWHISLGSWFRDYVYIPLGGSQVTAKRHIFNLFVVWLLTGIWHGANWTFIVWGLMYFLLLTFEKKTKLGNQMKKWPGFFKRLYTILFVMIGWVVFRADSLTDAAFYICNMFGIGTVGFADAAFVRFLKQSIIYILAGGLLCVPREMYHGILRLPKCKSLRLPKVVENVIYVVGLAVLFVLAFASIVSDAYNPFIYFNF